MAAVDATAIADRGVRSLSDGERQRVLIARALAQEPRLVILDEPTAYLDLPRRIETLGLLRRLVRENGVSVLLSTHHLDLALSHADRVWLLPLGGPLAIGAPEDVALSGALERTFVSDRLVFDRGEGTFRLREEPVRAAVVLEGDGLARRWVERALRREGLAAIDASGAGAGQCDGEGPADDRDGPTRRECAALSVGDRRRAGRVRQPPRSLAAAQGAPPTPTGDGPEPRQSSASRPYMSSSSSSSSFNTAWRCRPSSRKPAFSSTRVDAVLGSNTQA